MFKRFRKGNQRSTLTQGNIVSVAIQLYRAKGDSLFLSSFLGHLWLTLTLLGVGFGMSFLLLGSVILGAVAGRQASSGISGGWLLGFLVAAPFVFYGLSRFTACGGLLARQIFWHLRQETETLEEARAAIYPRMWVFGRSFLWSLLLLSLLYLVLAPVGLWSFQVWWQWIWEPVQTLELNTGWGATLRGLAIILLLLGLLVFVLIFVLAIIRLSFVDVVLAIEPPMSAWQAVVRSWQLTQKQTLHSALVLFLGAIVAWPASILASFLNLLTFVPVSGFFLGILLFPFWQGIKAILYYDLRCRNEGLNFDLATSIPSPRGHLQRVTIQTPESVELDFAMAGIGSRSFAWLVDQILLGLSLFLLTVGGAYLYAYAILPALEGIWNIDRIHQWAIAIYFFLLFILGNGYFIFFETLWQGQTPGKRLAEIRVVRDGGQPIRMMEAALRSLIKPVDLSIFFIGVVLIIFTKAEKRLGDMAAGTLVIQDETLTPATGTPAVSTTASAGSKNLARELLTNPALSEITPDQYLTLRDFLNQRQQLTPRVRVQTATKLTDQLRAVVLPQEPVLPEQLNEEEFLQAVYLAYRRYHRSEASSNGYSTSDGDSEV